MINSLRLFGIGASWGGYESLVLPTTGGIQRAFRSPMGQACAFRLQVGLEQTADLVSDLKQAFTQLQTA
jgi:cystathionine beta-lyase